MSDTALYTDLARYYDLMCADINYQEQSQHAFRLHRLLGAGGNEYLDLACGSGPHVEQFIAMGYNATGLDLNAPMVYDPHTEANLFHFTMIDNDGKRCKVALHKPRPQDFERSEQIVVIGQMENETFQARDILTKCPSKYNDAPTQTVDL